MGRESRRDSAISAVNDDYPETNSNAPELKELASEPHVEEGATPKRPLRLSHAHRRRVSERSISSRNGITMTSGKRMETSSSNISTALTDSCFPYVTPTSERRAFSFTDDNHCICCHSPNPSDSHDDKYPEKCWEHQICLARGGWKKHLERVPHTRCPISECDRAGEDFGTQERFLKHWVKWHEEKCWYWGKKKGLFGGEKSVWLQWNGS